MVRRTSEHMGDSAARVWLVRNVRNMLSVAPHVGTPLSHLLVEAEGGAAAEWLTRACVKSFRALLSQELKDAEKMIHVALNIFCDMHCQTVIPFGSMASRADPKHWRHAEGMVSASVRLRSPALSRGFADACELVDTQSAFQRRSQMQRSHRHPIRLFRPSVFLTVVFCRVETLLARGSDPLPSRRAPWSRTLLVAVLPTADPGASAAHEAVAALNASADPSSLFAMACSVESLPGLFMSLKECVVTSSQECTELLHSILSLEAEDTENIITIGGKTLYEWMSEGAPLL